MKLTPREKEIVVRVARGERRKQIAADLGISVNTVWAHLQRIRLKNAGRIPGAALKKPPSTSRAKNPLIGFCSRLFEKRGG